MCAKTMCVDSVNGQHCLSQLVRQPKAKLMSVGRAGSGGVKGQFMVVQKWQELVSPHFNMITIVRKHCIHSLCYSLYSELMEVGLQAMKQKAVKR